jgi:hypothetical protein
LGNIKKLKIYEWLRIVKFKIKQAIPANYFYLKLLQKDNAIQMYNFWKHADKNFWIKKYIENNNLSGLIKNYKLSFFSVFGSKRGLELDNSDLKIFYTPENIYEFPYHVYKDYGLNAGVDLAIGFDYMDSTRYARLPFWVISCLEPTSSFEKITAFCNSINSKDTNERPLFASLIARHDRSGLRKQMVDTLLGIDFIHCAGPIYNNTSLLRTEYKEDKISFLKNFKFNICPENSDATGYVTEKLFEAFMGGCIPVYWGSDNNPEPGIINPEAVIFWNSKGNNEASVALIEDLHRNEKRRKEFLNEPRLLPSAPENIYKMLYSFKCKLALCMEAKLKNQAG